MRGSSGVSRLLALVAAVTAVSLVRLAGQQAPAGARFTAAQAAEGRTTYQAQCSTCHQPDLKGQGAAAQGQRGAGAGAAAAPAAGRGRGAAAPAVGITVAGEVKNFTPVTDAMLRTVDPNDWLMIRRDYRASNYSPLNQITRDNVNE